MSCRLVQPNEYMRSRSSIRSIKYKLRKNATKAEIRFKSILKELKYKYEFQRTFDISGGGPTKFAIVDFYLYQYQIIIEVDGQDHKREINHTKDYIREKKLLRSPVVKTIIRFTDKEVLNMPIDKISMRIQSYVY